MSLLTRTNLVSNPSWRAQYSTAILRTNICSNPSFGVDAANWSTWAGNGGAGSTITRQNASDTPRGTTGYGRISWAGGTAPTSGGGCRFAMITLAASTSYTGSAYVRPSVALTVQPQVQFYNSGTPTANYAGTSTVCPANVWTRVSVTAKTGASDNQGEFRFYVVGAGVTTSTLIDIDDCMIEIADGLMPYFDGAGPTPSMYLGANVAWSGVAHASVSVLRGSSTSASPFTGYTSSASRTFSWSTGLGTGAIIAQLAMGGTAIWGFTYQTPVAVNPGDYTSLGMEVRIMPGTSAVPLRLMAQLNAYSPATAGMGTLSALTSVTIPNDGSWVSLKSAATTPLPAGAVTSRVIIRAPSEYDAVAGVVFEFRNVIIEKVPGPGIDVGPYFDGDTPNTDAYRYTWMGDPNLSTSLMQYGYSMTVNGTDIQNFAFNVKQRGSRWRTPKKRGSNRELPGLHGTSMLKGKPYDENVIVLGMWAIGAKPDGSVPYSAESLVLENLDQLSRLFSAPQLNIVQQRKDGDRTLIGEVTQTIDFASEDRATRADFNVEIVVPGAFWFDVAETAQTVVTATATTYAFTSFSAGTAPLVNATYEVTGPVNSPVLTDPVTGQWVKLTTNVPAGQKWIVNSADWSSKLNGVSVLDKTTHGEGATFLDLTADPTGPKVTLGGTGMTSATSIRITARKAYLLA